MAVQASLPLPSAALAFERATALQQALQSWLRLPQKGHHDEKSNSAAVTDEATDYAHADDVADSDADECRRSGRAKGNTVPTLFAIPLSPACETVRT
jgi:hypothetical protein